MAINKKCGDIIFFAINIFNGLVLISLEVRNSTSIFVTMIIWSWIFILVNIIFCLPYYLQELDDYKLFYWSTLHHCSIVRICFNFEKFKMHVSIRGHTFINFAENKIVLYIYYCTKEYYSNLLYTYTYTKFCFRMILYLILNIFSFILAGTFASITFLLTISFWALSYDISGKLELGDAFFLGMYLYRNKPI